MDVKDFGYDLPEELIAQTPLKRRTDSRLLVLDRFSGEMIHEGFRDLKSYLRAGDCLVLNDTKVFPARLLGVREDTGAAVELLLLRKQEDGSWESLVKPGRKCRPGDRLTFGDGKLKGEIIRVAEEGSRRIRFTHEGIFEEILDEIGQTPLPPYITKTLEDASRYQTVYARHDGSAAAPTAGLHFTEDLLKDIEDMGVHIDRITLHVGLGTFRPVKTDRVEDHHMHAEYFHIRKETASRINMAKQKGGRVICVGTTVCRTLESMANKRGLIEPGSGITDIFIYPGYRFKAVDGLITNFHLPESTLLMLVSAFAGKDNIDRAYREAIKRRYRFFSFGDAMFIH